MEFAQKRSCLVLVHVIYMYFRSTTKSHTYNIIMTLYHQTSERIVNEIESLLASHYLSASFPFIGALLRYCTVQSLYLLKPRDVKGTDPFTVRSNRFCAERSLQTTKQSSSGYPSTWSDEHNRATFDVVFRVIFFPNLVAGCHCTLHVVPKHVGVRRTCTSGTLGWA
jgi:hypothetical protein